MSAAAVIVIRQKRTIKHLINVGAFSPETAIPLSELPYGNKWYIRRLIKAGLIKEIEGKCYVEGKQTLQQFQKRLLRKAAIFITVSLAIFLMFLAISSLKN